MCSHRYEACSIIDENEGRASWASHSIKIGQTFPLDMKGFIPGLKGLILGSLSRRKSAKLESSADQKRPCLPDTHRRVLWLDHKRRWCRMEHGERACSRHPWRAWTRSGSPKKLGGIFIEEGRKYRMGIKAGMEALDTRTNVR